MFTIEDLIERIYEPNSKDLFKDIYASYTQGQYRATVVMLWTAVVCDLVYKLQYLKDIYNDGTAIDILEKIAKKQKENPKNPQWETYLISEVKERTKLITDIEKDNLEYLQKQRNLCAHPVITNDNILFKPNKELTRSLMRIALESVLIKTPLLSKEYIDIILEDFETKEDIFVFEDDNFEKYFYNKYIKHLNINQILNLFQLLWRIVFMPHNDREEHNISINSKLLQYILKTYKSDCIKHIKQKIDFYTYDNTNEEANIYFNDFIIRNYKFFPILSEQTKSLLKAEYRPFPQNIPYFFLSSKSLDEYLDELNNDFKTKNPYVRTKTIWVEISYLINQAKEYALTDKLYDMFIEWYSDSNTYDKANLLFSDLIHYNLKYFSLQQITKLLILSSQNDQTFSRARAQNTDNKLIVQQYIKLNGKYSDIKDTVFEGLFKELGGDTNV